MCALSNGDIADDLEWPLSAPKLPQFVHFFTAIHSFVTGEPRDFKFCILIAELLVSLLVGMTRSSLDDSAICYVFLVLRMFARDLTQEMQLGHMVKLTQEEPAWIWYCHKFSICSNWLTKSSIGGKVWWLLYLDGVNISGLIWVWLYF